MKQAESKFKINLEYQIFTNNVVAKPAFITADYYRLIDPNNPKRYKELESHPYYEMLLSKHEEALALSNTIFK